jgi:4-carboxymuconolactone decarboxylase
VRHETVSGRLSISNEKISGIEGDNYKTSTHFTEDEKALLDLTEQIGADANRVSQDLWALIKDYYNEPQIVEAVYVIAEYTAISKFGDALGVVLEPVFKGLDPLLHVENHG